MQATCPFSPKNSSKSMIVDVPTNSDFPLENIPFGVISTQENPVPRPATAIGDYALDLSVLAAHDLFNGPILSKAAKAVFTSVRAIVSRNKKC